MYNDENTHTCTVMEIIIHVQYDEILIHVQYDENTHTCTI